VLPSPSIIVASLEILRSAVDVQVQRRRLDSVLTARSNSASRSLFLLESPGLAPGSSNPVPERLTGTADLRCNGDDGGPLRGIFIGVLHHQPDRPLPDLG
jgi:hypothetical protein